MNFGKELKKMKWINRISLIVIVISIFAITLITSVEIAAYGDWDFYKKEYEKNNVLTAVGMEMDDLMEVTKEMMAYLRGDRDDLVVETTMFGQTREFFNDREKQHMADCKVLFVGAIWIRRICFALMALSIGIICGANKSDIKNKIRIISGGIWKGILIFIGLAGALIGVIALNFDKAFVTFHKIFFDNDLWILNPQTDMLINIVPQQFFIDISIRIGIIFGILMFLIFSIPFIAERVIIKKLVKKQ